MKKLILIICLSSFLGGCAILSPWKSPTSCSDTANNGAACATVESNLEYSIKKDETPVATPVASHSEDVVVKDELGRLFAEMAIDSSVTKKPTFIPAITYRVLIFPYSAGSKFYSSRYVYITAGKPRWVTGNIVTDGAKHIKADVPVPKVKRIEAAETVQNITFTRPIVKQPDKPVRVKARHRVSAYMLNCREQPDMESIAVAVFEQDRVLDITDKSLDWWKVNFYELECYVNSKYLYAESEK